MSRAFFVLLVAFFGFVTLVSAQQTLETLDGRLLIEPVSGEADQMVNGAWVPVELEPITDPVSFERAINSANDVCNMTNDNLPAFSEVGTTFTSSDATQVNGYSVDSTDPDLSYCIDNAYQSTKGYRTAWYRFTAPATGSLRIETISNASYQDNYDTVIALYQASSCGDATTPLTCNDDRNGLLSIIEWEVTQGETYFIEIADRNLSVNNRAIATIIVQVDTVLQYETVSGPTPSTEEPYANRSRHSSVVIDNEIYLFGGQTVVDAGQATRTKSNVKFNPATSNWTTLANMPPNCDVNGYSNTDAVFVEYNIFATAYRKVFFPSGFVGDNGEYSGTHCIYDVETNAWSYDTSSTAPWSTGKPAIYSVAVPLEGSGYVVAGGLNDKWLATIDAPSTALTDTLAYDARDNTWSVRNGLNSARYAHTGTLINNGTTFCVVGGLKPAASAVELLPDGECLDIGDSNATWTTIAGNNVPRFNAASYVDADGNWLVFGGVNSSLDPVATTERYNALTNMWETLDDRYAIERPERAWMRGGVVTDTLYLIGGETSIDSSGDGSVTGLVTTFTFPEPPVEPTTLVPTNYVYLPAVLYQPEKAYTLSKLATRMGIGQTVANNFNDNIQRFHVYAFDVASAGTYALSLTKMPVSDNYDLILLSEEKIELATSTNVSHEDELISIALTPGEYFVFVMVNTNYPLSTGNYRLSVTR